MEGTHCYVPSHDCDQPGLTLPVAEYSHAGGNCSVTGGYVYRGAKYPSIQGVYFFSDYCGGTVWALTHEANGSWTRTEVVKGTSGVSSFGEDENGELYVCDLNNGVVYHLAAAGK
jgi:hypothetical protein